MATGTAPAVRPAKKGELVSLLNKAIADVRRHRKAYVAMNVLFYGLMLMFMALIFLNPGYQEAKFEAIRRGITKVGFMRALVDAYESGNIPKAAVLTFLVNLTLGSMMYITVPSLIVPFAGLPLGAWRAIQWGLIFGPATADSQRVFIPHVFVLIMEGQAYVLAMLAVWLQGKALLLPKIKGRATAGRRFVWGLEQTARIYLLIAIVLAVAALFEALELLVVPPRPI